MGTRREANASLRSSHVLTSAPATAQFRVCPPLRRVTAFMPLRLLLSTAPLHPSLTAGSIVKQDGLGVVVYDGRFDETTGPNLH